MRTIRGSTREGQPSGEEEPGAPELECELSLFRVSEAQVRSAATLPACPPPPQPLLVTAWLWASYLSARASVSQCPRVS